MPHRSLQIVAGCVAVAFLAFMAAQMVLENWPAATFFLFLAWLPMWLVKDTAHEFHVWIARDGMEECEDDDGEARKHGQDDED